MSIYGHGDGLFWLSLSSFIDGKEKKKLLEQLAADQTEYTAKDLASCMLLLSSINFHYSADDRCVQAACEHVALKFLLCDSDFAKCLMSAEDLAKANELYARKQYNSKLLKKLLRDFLKLTQMAYMHNKLINLFTLSIVNEYDRVRDDELSRSHGELKKTVERVASGVKSSCYLDAERNFYEYFSESLNQFISSRINYDFKKANERNISNMPSTLFCNREHKVSNSVLQRALLDDAEFWSKHEDFSVVTFLNEIEKQNDIRHAEKVLSFIIENLQKMPHMKVVLEHNFPLYMSKYDELAESLEDQAFRFSFKRLEPYCDISKLKGVPLCYPMSKAEPDFFEIGKHVWERFIRNYNYPNDYEAVEAYLSNEVSRFISGETGKSDDIAVILDAAPFRYSADSDDRRLFTAYHPDCFSIENIWKRVYLKAYAVTILSEDGKVQFSYLQRIFIDLIKTVEVRLGICTAHQLDTTTRDKHFEELKQKLAAYDINATEKHKSDYIISLLDRDTALIEEAKSFPILEQIGDAIYGLAVAELLFYNPDSLFYPDYDPSGNNIRERFEKFTRAEAQVLISKKLGFDKLYLQIGLPAKYVEYDSIYFDYETSNEEKLQELNKEKYLADSLEMIIGAVYIDNGLDAALRFAKQLLKETYPEHFSKEIRLEDRKGPDEDIDWEYWQRILPGPYSDMSAAHYVIWNALHKVVLIDSIGTDGEDKRKYITYSLGNTAIYGEEHEYGVSWPLFCYLHDGLAAVLNKYGDTVRKNYENSKNSN